MSAAKDAARIGYEAGEGSDHDVARALAETAGQVLLELRREGERDPGELRAEGDARSQRVLAAALATARPHDAVLSEEAKDDPGRLSSNRVWIIDPLDGTREFGEIPRDDWAVHVALWEDGELRAGAVARPARDDVLWTGEPARRPTGTPRRIRLAVSRTRPPAFVQALAERLDAELVPMGSAGIKATAVLDETVDAYVHAGGQYEWDSAAPVAVARAAGLHASRIDGSPLEYNRVDPLLPDLLICRPEIAAVLLSAIAGLTDEESPVVTESLPRYHLSQLDALEAESIFIFREVAAEFEKPVLLFSGGKDSLVMLRLAEKAFHPARIPFHVMHVDTGQNFPEVLELRDRRVDQLGVRLVVASVQDAIDRGLVTEPPDGTRNRIQTPVLLDGIERGGYTAIFGGARRDEDKARAKERIFSFRDEFGQWDPKNQRPELWGIYNGRIHPGESIRVFPISNWTELDIWHYIAREGIELPSIYYAHDREVVERKGMLYAVNGFISPRDGETVSTRRVRYRTVGDATLTAAVESEADDVHKVIDEVAVTRITERGATRGDDKFSEAAMEDRKREGYF